MQIASRNLFSLCALALSLVAPPMSLLFGQIEPATGLDYIPFATATEQSVSTGQPLMVLGFTEG